MGVSAGGNSDLDLAVAGGPGFAQRIAELASAKTAYEKALNDLDLGRSATEANDQAARRLTEATNKRDADLKALDAEVVKAREGLNAWVEQTKRSTMAAYDEANIALADAKAQQSAAEAANKLAQAAKRQAEADGAIVVKDSITQANQIVMKAEEDAGKIIAEAEAIRADARAALADAVNSKAKYDAAIANIANISANIGR